MRGPGHSHRLVAVVILVVGILCLRRAFQAMGAATAGNALSPAFAAILAAAGILSVFGAWRFWAGEGARLKDLDRAAPLFGRDARQPTRGPSRGRPFLAAVAVLAAAGLLTEHFILRQQPPETGNPPSAEPATPPEQPGGAEPPEQKFEPAEPEPPAKPGSDQAKAPDPAPSVPAEPAEPENPAKPAEPPTTTAPLPEKPAQPELAEGHHDAVVWIDVSPDGHSLLSASTDRMVKLWDLEDPRLVRDLGIHKAMVRTALFMPDGMHEIDAGDDGEIVVRKIADGVAQHVFSAGQNGGVNKLAISPDGKLAVSGHQTGTVVVWDLEHGNVLHALPGHDWSIAGVAVSPDGDRAVSGSIDGELKLWDIRVGKLLRTWRGHEQGAYGVAFTPDGHRLVTGSGDHVVKLWDLDTGQQVRRFDGHSGTVYCIAVSKDGSQILSGSLDGTARLWDLNTGAELAQFNPDTGPIYSVAFGPHGYLLTGGYDRSIRHWKASGAGGAILFAGAPQ